MKNSTLIARLTKWLGKRIFDHNNQCGGKGRFEELGFFAEEERGQERQRRILYSGLVGMLSKALSAAATLITIPLTLRYLGDERFGLWMAISSLIALLSFADLGIGNGLLNTVSSANRKDNHQALKKSISSATLVLCVIAVIMVTIFGFAYSYINWATLFHLTTPVAIEEAGPAALIFIILFALNLPISITQKVQAGLQLGFLSNIWQIIASIFTIVAILLVVNLKVKLPYLVLAQAGSPVIIGLLNGVIFFSGQYKSLAPKFSLANIFSGFAILKAGSPFFILQIVAALMYSSDGFIIARVLGAQDVPMFSVSDKIFSLVTVVISTSLIPLWPAYSEALARGDIAWSVYIFKKSICYSLVTSVVLVLTLIFFGQSIIDYWIGESMVIPFGLIIGMGIWKVLESIGSALAMFLNGASIVSIQAKIAIITAILTIVLKFQLVEMYGISGSIYATIICYVLFALTPFFLLRKKIIYIASLKKNVD